MIYLDHNASSPIRPSVVEAMTDALRELGGNPSSVHRAGQAARNALDRARAEVAATIGVAARDVVFTSGATEANQLAILGVQLMTAEPPLIVSSPAEHPSLLGAVAARLAAEPGAEVVYLELDPAGRIDADALEAVLRAHADRPTLVSLMMAQNELGNLYPVAALARIARRYGALFHTDATQALGRVPLDLEALGVDLASFSAHKLGGPKGVGALYARRGVELGGPLVRGGHQERGRRAGTENVPGIVGFAAACREVRERGLADWPRVRALTAQLAHGVMARVDGVHWLGDREHDLGNTCCLAVEGVPSDVLLMALDLAGIAVSAGSACASGSLEPSPVLLAMGVAPELARCAVRLSLGWSTTQAEVEQVIEVMAAEIAHVRAVAQRGLG